MNTICRCNLHILYVRHEGAPANQNIQGLLSEGILSLSHYLPIYPVASRRRHSAIYLVFPLGCQPYLLLPSSVSPYTDPRKPLDI
jgi:hypothetical protein